MKKAIIISICLVLITILLTVSFNSLFFHKEDSEITCYVTQTGECYHNIDCGYLRSIREMTVASAKADGYRACYACDFPNNDYGTAFMISIMVVIVGGFFVWVYWDKITDW